MFVGTAFLFFFVLAFFRLVVDLIYFKAFFTFLVVFATFVLEPRLFVATDRRRVGLATRLIV